MSDEKIYYNRYVICPWCAYCHEEEFNDGESLCSECGKPFVVVKDIEVTYLTFRPDKK